VIDASSPSRRPATSPRAMAMFSFFISPSPCSP
jgi:hypothetical protein